MYLAQNSGHSLLEESTCTPMQKFGLQTYTVKNDRDSRIAHAIIQQLIIEIIHFDWTNGKTHNLYTGWSRKNRTNFNAL